MKPIIRMIFALAVCTSFGCAMCCGPFDYDYPNYGGKHERADRSFGRVGSLFSDPWVNPMGDSADSNLKDAQPRGRRNANDDEEDSDEADELKRQLEVDLNQSPNPDRDANFRQSRPAPSKNDSMQRPAGLGQWR